MRAAPADPPRPRPTRRPVRGRRVGRNARKDTVLAVLATLLAALLVGHRLVPAVGGLAVLVDSFLPWLGLLAVPLTLIALGVCSRIGLLALLLPVVAWSALFLPDLAGQDAAGDAGLQVATQNLRAGNPVPMTTAAELARTGAELLAVQELTGRSRPAFAAALEPTHPYVATVGTIGLWSRYPLRDTRRLDLGQSWSRALRTRVRAPGGDLVVYVVHLPSVRLGAVNDRARALHELAGRITTDPADRLLLLGDLNTAATDRALAPLTRTLQEARNGFGFTWPAGFPLTRPDHILCRGLTIVRTAVLTTAGSDHRAALATLRRPPA